MANRIKAAVAALTKTVEQRVKDGVVTAEQAEDSRKKLDMDLVEYVRLQDLKSLASVDGTLSLEEAQYVYSLMGESLDTFNALPLAEKYVLTQLLGELSAKRLAGNGVGV